MRDKFKPRIRSFQRTSMTGRNHGQVIMEGEFPESENDALASARQEAEA